MLNKFLIAFFFFQLFSVNAYAYFDPGTGAYIVQVILAFLASCYLFIKNPFKYIREYLKSKKKKNNNNEQK